MNRESKSSTVLVQFSEAFDRKLVELDNAALNLSKDLRIDRSHARLLAHKISGLEGLLEEVAGKIEVPDGKNVASHAAELTDSFLSTNGPADALAQHEESQIYFALAFCNINHAIQHLKLGSYLSAIDVMTSVASLLFSGLQRAPEEVRTKASQIAAEARHSAPGGSRQKREAIRAAWASGKYTSRDICAEQECGALGISFSTARKALRNTPNPS